MELLIDILKQYGWQALCVALFVFLLIELIKPIARKVIKQTNIRHTVYVAINYASTLGFSALLSLILKQSDKTFQLYGSAIIVVNILYPIIANLGLFNWIAGLFKELLAKTTENGAWKKVLSELAKKFGIDPEVADKIATKIEEEYLPKINADAEDFFKQYKDELILNIKQKLAGFVENGQLQTVAEELFKKLKESWVKSDPVEIEPDPEAVAVVEESKNNQE